MRQRSSGRPRRHGQRSGSRDGPGLGPCTMAPLHTRMVSAGLDDGHLEPHGSASGRSGWAQLCGVLCKELSLTLLWSWCHHLRQCQGPRRSVGTSLLCLGLGELGAVRHGHRSVQECAWGQPWLAAGMLWPRCLGRQQPGGARCGLWSCVRLLLSLMGVCSVPCPLFCQLGGGSTWPLQLQWQGDSGCVCSWVCVAVLCLTRGSAVPTATQLEH